MCTSQKVPRLLVKIRETLVYTEIASTLLQLNLFSWNLSLNFLTLTLPPKVKLHCKLETFQWTLSGCRFFDLAITPPVCSFFLVLFCWPMWHHPIKQQCFVRYQFAHITAEHLCPRSPTEDDRGPSACPGTAILNAFLTMRKTGRGESFAVLLWHVLVLEAHFKCIIHIKYSPFF